MDYSVPEVTSAEREFYGENLILLEGAISEFLSCMDMIRRYEVQLGNRDPVASSQTRIKSAESMRQKLQRLAFPVTAESAMKNVFDAAGVRLVCPFIQDIDRTAELIRAIPGVHPQPEAQRLSKLSHDPFDAAALSGKFPKNRMAGGPAAHHRHGLLGQYRTSAEI